MDTNVLVSALRSARGASFKLLSMVDSGAFSINLSVALVLEYEDACTRLVGSTAVTQSTVQAILDYLCMIGTHRRIHYLWRPFLRDPKDDMVLELAVAAGCDAVVSYNVADFQGIETFGIRVVTPAAFLREIGHR